MIPILYDKDETSFASNGLGRLRGCISCVVTEERNGIYECDFKYPVTGAHFDEIQYGRIIAVEHDESNDVQPFDIVSASKPIDGVVMFHAVHISYRQSKLVAYGTGVNTIAAAFTMLGNSQPSNPFTYESSVTGNGYMSAADGEPRSVRSLLGGVEGSILDTYGGEYEWNKFRVILHSARGEYKNYTIRYGVNLLGYNEDIDCSETYSSIIPYWKGTDVNGNPLFVIGDKQDYTQTTSANHGETVPVDLTDKFESQPTKAQVESMGQTYLSQHQPTIPQRNIKVSFVQLQDSEEFQQYANLLSCKLCDTVRVVFPMYNMTGNFKIVKTVWNVLLERYDEMELGTLATTLSEALGIGFGSSTSGGGGSLLDTFYPIGSYYETSDGTFDPNTAWGGTWELEASGKVHVSAGTGYTLGATGGEATHTLTESEMPNHDHQIIQATSGSGNSIVPNQSGSPPASGYTLISAYDAGGGWVPSGSSYVGQGGWNANTKKKGGGNAHNNMQPYIVVNRWHRTA